MSQENPSKRSRPDDDEVGDVPSPRKLPKVSIWKSKIPSGAVTKLIDLKLIEGNQQIMVRVCARRKNGTRIEYGVMDDSGERTMKVFQKLWKQFQELEINVVYKFSNFTVRPGYKGGDPEIILLGKSTVDRIDDDGFKKIQFNFTDLKDINAVPDGTSIDIIGIVTKVKDVDVTKSGVNRLEIYVDDHVAKCDLSVYFWGEDADAFKTIKPFTPIIIRAGVKTTFNEETTLQIKYFTQIWENPSIPEAKSLYESFEKAALEEGINLLTTDQHSIGSDAD